MKLLDISPLISPTLAVWPGDEPFVREVSRDMRAGANLTLSSMRTTLHVGAHADAPSHYAKLGSGIAERELGLYYGPCQVVAVEVARGARVLPDHVATQITAPRVLFRTGSYPDPGRFNEDFCALSPEVIHHLHARGVVLVGVDTPSIDLFADKTLEAHQAVAQADMAVLEGLVLAGVPAGHYTLIALPLKIEGGDAAPVRAALVS